MARLTPGVIPLLGALRAVHAHEIPSSETLLPDIGLGQCGWGSSQPLRAIRPVCPQPIGEDVVGDPEQWGPWTHKPFCADSNYCVFTNSMFQGNHGISIITTPEIASDSLHLIEKSFATSFLTAHDEATGPPYEVRDLPGKGKGVIATRKIHRGEIFMIDYASVIADVAFPGRVRRTQGQKLLEKAINQLPDPSKILMLAQSSTKGAPIVEDVLRTNTFGAQLNDESYMALFPEISRMNHACNPNAFTRFSQKTLAMTAVAFRDVEPGEEISISYSEFGLLYQERQDALSRRWGFKCTCDLCRASPKEIEESDRRRVRIKAIRDEILGHVSHRRYNSAVNVNRELLRLVVEEGLVAHLGEHYEIHARLYYNMGDMENARRYGELALADLRRFGGPDVYDTVNGLEDLLTRI